MDFWISPEVFQWPSCIESWSSGPDDWDRPYEHWKHALERSENIESTFNRIDIVTSLKRASQLRLNQLASIYMLKNTRTRGKRLGTIEILECHGLLRPMMVEKLHSIRNQVEHQDVDPPSASECIALVEFIWYLLKSTDSLVRQVTDTFILDQGSSPFGEIYWLETQTGPIHEWSTKLRGWIPQEFASKVPSDGWIKLNATEVKKALKVRKSSFQEHGELNLNGRSSDLSIDGVVTGPADCIELFQRAYFSASM